MSGYLDTAARIFLQAPGRFGEVEGEPVPVGDEVVRRVVNRLSSAEPALLRQLRRCVESHESRPTWRTRSEVVELVTIVATANKKGSTT